MTLKDYCKKEGKQYLLDEWDEEKICRLRPKLLAVEVQYPYGGNAKKVIHGKRKCEAVQKHLQDAPNALKLKWQKKESNEWKNTRKDSL